MRLHRRLLRPRWERLEWWASVVAMWLACLLAVWLAAAALWAIVGLLS